MTEKLVRVPPEMTASDTIVCLRLSDPEVESFSDLYVLNAAKQLVRVISLRAVITTPPKCHLSEIMKVQVITIAPETDQEEVARLDEQYDLLALPVVAVDRWILGIITVDDVTDVMVQEGTEDVPRFGGVECGSGDQLYFTVPLTRAVRKRIVWLLLLFLASTLTSGVVRLFENELAEVIVLSSFIPLPIGTGGNTGAQTVLILIRRLALAEIQLRDTERGLGVR